MSPLAGVKVFELSGPGPVPYCGMLLADLGADVVKIEKKEGAIFSGTPDTDYMNRSKRSIAIDLKSPEGKRVAKSLIAASDVVIEGFRPGVMERLGLGPEQFHESNSKLIYTRLTGWGQTGPSSRKGGHDINYIAESGVLYHIGMRGNAPSIPLNLIADFAGGGLMAAYAVMSTLYQRTQTGRGDVLDVGMFDSCIHLMSSLYGAVEEGYWSTQRGTNLLDSGAPFYNVYEALDGNHIAVGAIEWQFYSAFLNAIGVSSIDSSDQFNNELWPRQIEIISNVVRTKPLSDWMKIFDDVDACVSPVTPMSNVPSRAHAERRKSFVKVASTMQPAFPVRFKTSFVPTPKISPTPGSDSRQILSEFGRSERTIEKLIKQGIVSI